MGTLISQKIFLPNHPAGRSGNSSPESFPWLEQHPGLARSMSRAAVMLVNCAQQLEPEVINLLRTAKFEAAIYCAADQSTANHPAIIDFLESKDKNRASAFSANLPPKWGLQSSIGLVAVPVSIFLETMGGVHTFHHSELACAHAVAQAKKDLRQGRIRYAVVCAVSSTEDPLTERKHLSRTRAKSLQEGAGVVVLGRDGEVWEEDFMNFRSVDDETFGIGDPLLRFLTGEFAHEA